MSADSTPAEEVTKVDSRAPSLALLVEPVAALLVFCSHCGRPVEGEYGPAWFPADVVTHPGRYPFEDDGWQRQVDGRALVCPACDCVDWCDECGEKVHAWQPQVNRPFEIRARVVHEGCADGETVPLVAAEGGA